MQKETNIPKYDKIKQIQKYHKHKSLFNIKNNKYLDLFENLLNKSKDFRLECSIKLDGEIIFPCRFNIFYKGKNHIKNINLAFNFLNELSKLGVKINYDLLKQIFNKNVDLDLIKKVIVGIDLRENDSESRAKFWLMIDRKYVDLFNKVLNLHEYNQKVIELINKNKLLFGFDFRFDGTTRIKIYPNFDKSELKNEVLINKLQNIFSPVIYKLITKCQELHISFEGKDYDRILHFNPYDLNIFLDSIQNRVLNKWENKIHKLADIHIISLNEKEINDNKIKKINFYY